MTKLIKIGNYWIVVGNEDIQKDDWIYDEFGLRQARWGVDKLFKQPKVLFSQNPDHKLPNITFSEEVAKELGEVDIEQKALEAIPIGDEDTYFDRLEWIKGYNQCKEDNKEKKYTEENLKFHINEFMEFCGKNYHYDAHFGWYEIGNPGHRPNNSTLVDEYVQSLKQEYEVEIEMKADLQPIEDSGVNFCSLIPNIINNSITIIKLLK